MRRCLAAGLILVAASCQQTATPIVRADRTEPVPPAARTREIADAIVAEAFAAAPSRVAMLRPPGARYDALPDDSIAATLRRAENWRAQLAELEAIDASALTGDARVAHELATSWLERSLALRACKPERWRVSQMQGWLVGFADAAAAQPVGTPELREQALARYAQLPRYVDEQIAALRQGLAEGWSAPRLVVDHVVRQVDSMLAADFEAAPFASPALRDGDAAFRARYEELLRDAVNPALRRYREFLASEYAPRARATIGVSASPGGAACYRATLLSYTTLDIAPEEVHARGLTGVAEVERELAAISVRSFGGVPPRALLERLRSEPDYRYRDEAHMLSHASDAVARAWEAMPRAFSRVPRARSQVEPIPAYQARTAAAHYLSAALDGSRPGTYRVRTFEAAGQSWAQGQSVAFHEVVPGHHLQIALANEDSALPAIARFLFTSGFSEGWGLYAEQLADELGLFTSDVDRVGMLSNRSMRAARMVVDSGMHALGWSRERAVDYLLAHTTMSRQQAEQETDRYIAQPGQAPSYYLGYQEILGLREQARGALGARFDLREFHDLVLGGGSTTLPLLRTRVDAWLGETQRAAEPAPIGGIAPLLDLRDARGERTACTKSAEAIAYRARLEAVVAASWKHAAISGYAEPAVAHVAHDAEGAFALGSIEHSRASVIEAARSSLAAMQSEVAPACLRDREAQLVFLVPWNTDLRTESIRNDPSAGQLPAPGLRVEELPIRDAP